MHINIHIYIYIYIYMWARLLLSSAWNSSQGRSLASSPKGLSFCVICLLTYVMVLTLFVVSC